MFPTPPLFPFQKKAVNWLKNRKTALLSLEMGLGKTAISISALDEINANRVLVLCPAVAVPNWHSEHLRFARHHRTLEVYSYGSLHKVPKGPWDVVILDESHYLKSTDAKRTKLVLGQGGILHQTRKAWCLSGTPAPNNASELWPILYSFGCTPLKLGDFVERYCTHRLVSGKHFQITGTKKEKIPELKELLDPIMLRETAKSVGLELPKVTFETVLVRGSKIKPDENIFDKLIRERNELQRLVESGRYLTELTAAANSISTLRKFNGLQKIEPVVELVRQELADKAYGKIIIFAIHKEVVGAITKELAQFKAVKIRGDTEQEKRIEAIKAFQQDPKCQVFVGNILAAGTAITLTAADQVLFAEVDWVPGNNAQGIKRASRIGSTKPLHVRFVSLDDAIDERITRTLERKTAELSALFAV